MELGRLRVIITGDDSGVRSALGRTERNLRQTARAADRHTRGIGGSFSSMGKGAMGAIGMLGGASVGLAGLIGGLGVQQAASAEQAKIAFTTITGSAERADKMLGKLQKFAATTPFEFPELRDSASRLMAVGTRAKDVIPIMSALGDATSAMGTGSEGISRAVTALTQMRQKGKVTGEEMLQLAEAGVPAWDALSSSLGMTVADTQKAVSEGKVSVDQLYAAIENRSGKAMGKVNGMMAAQSQSLTGLISTLKDNVTMELGKAAQPLADSLKAQLPAISAAIGPLVAGLTPVFTAVAGAIGPLVTLLQPVVTALGSIAEAVAPVITQLAGALAPILAGLVPIVADVAAQLGGTLGRVIGMLAPVLATLVAALAPVLPLVASLADAVVSALTPVLDALLPPLLSVVGILIEALMPIIEALTPVLQALGGSLGQVLAALAPVLVPIAQLLAVVLQLIQPILQLVTYALTPLTAVLTFVAEKIALVVTWLVGMLTPVIQVLVNQIKAKLGPTLAGLTRWFGNVWKSVKDGIQTVRTTFDSVVSFVTGLPGRISSAAVGMWDGIKSAFRGVLAWIAGAWNALEFSIPSAEFMGQTIGGFTLGVPDIEIPALAAGGIVTRPTLALIGEAGPEAVVPLSRGRQAAMGNTYNLTIQVTGSGVDAAMVRREARAAGEQLMRELRDTARAY